MQILNIQIGGLGFATLQNWSADQYQELGNNNIDILYLDTHANQLEQLSSQVQSLSANTHGAGGDLYSGMASFETIEEQVQSKIQDYDLIIIIAGFGGGTGSSFTKEVVRLCNSNNKFCFVIGNTLKRHEQYFDTPKNTYELVTEYLDNNCPYLLINSVKIQNELAQTNQQARVYEKYFANLSFSILSSFNLCLNAGIDLSDIQDKLGLGLTHFAIANSNEINENYRTLTFDNYYKGKVRNLKSYLLLYPVLVSQENQDQLLEKFDQEFEVSDCKIQAIDGDIFVFLGRLTKNRTGTGQQQDSQTGQSTGQQDSQPDTNRTPLFVDTNQEKSANGFSLIGLDLSNRTANRTTGQQQDSQTGQSTGQQDSQPDTNRTVTRQEFLDLFWQEQNLDNMSLRETVIYINSNIETLEKKYQVTLKKSISKSSIEIYKNKLKIK